MITAEGLKGSGPGSGERESVPESRERERYQMGELGLEEEMSVRGRVVMERCVEAEVGGWGPITWTEAPPQKLEGGWSPVLHCHFRCLSNLRAINAMGLLVHPAQGVLRSRGTM